MKLERNHNIYQVIDKSIEEINKDLETIDFELGVLNFSQKMRTITASVNCRRSNKYLPLC